MVSGDLIFDKKIINKLDKIDGNIIVVKITKTDQQNL